jgi:hypothetical protein
MTIAARRSLDVGLSDCGGREDATLFGEAPGRVIVAVGEEGDSENLVKMAAEHHLQIRQIGSFRPGFTLGIALKSARLLWEGANLWHNHCSTIDSLINLEA